MKRKVFYSLLVGVLVCTFAVVTTACSTNGGKSSQKKGMPVAVVHTYDGMMVIDTNGTELFDASVYKSVMTFSEGLAAVVDKNDMLGFVNKNGKIVIPCQFQYDDSFSGWDWGFGRNMRRRNMFHDGYARIESLEQSIFIDKHGKQLLKDYKVVNWNQDVAIVLKEGSYGLVDMSGRVILSPEEGKELDILEFCGDNMLRYGIGDYYGNMDEKGKIITDPKYVYAADFVDGYALVGKKTDDRYVVDVCVIDTKGKVQKKLDLDECLYSELRQGYLSQKLFSDGVMVSNCEGFGEQKTNYIYNSKYDVITLDYYYCSEFQDGLSATMPKSSRYYGFINTKGEMVIPAQFEQSGYYDDFSKPFSEGLCFAKQNKKWTVIDKKGNTISVLDGIDEPVSVFVAGRACVRIGYHHSHFAFVDRFGNEMPIPMERSTIFFYSDSDNSDDDYCEYWGRF